MKNFLLKSTLLLCVLIAGVATVWGTETYTKITSTSGLVTGAEYLIVYEDGENSYAVGEETGSGSNTYRTRVAVSMSSSSISIDNENVVVFTLGENTYGYTFLGSDNKYLAKNSNSDSQNYLNSSYTDNDNKTRWTITYTNAEVSIRNVSASNYYIRYNKNANTERFSCYKNTQQPVALYRKDVKLTYNVSPDASGSISVSNEDENEVSSGDVVEIGSSLNIVATPAEGKVFSGWSVTGTNSSVSDTYSSTTTFKMGTAHTTLTATFIDAPAYAITAVSNNNEYGTVSLAGTVISASPQSGCRYASPAYSITSGTATVSQDGNTFTVTPTSDCTVTINFEEIPSHTATFSVNGITSTESYIEGADIVFPDNPEDIGSYEFFGWVDEAISGSQSSAPTYTSSLTMGNADKTYYAVFAQVTGTPASLTITTSTTNIPTSYGTANTFTEYTLEGKKFKVQQMYLNGGKLQWRASGNSNGTGTMYNTDKLAKIQSIVLTYDASDDNKNFTVKVGDSENPTSGTSITPSNVDKVYTYDCSAEKKNYFVLTNGTNAGYLTSIQINYTSETIDNYRTTIPLHSRAVTTDDWGTICLPYAVAAADRSGATFYNISGKTASALTLTEETGSLVAGKPYIFKATASSLVAVYNGDAASVQEATGLVGNLDATPLTVPTGKYIITGNEVREVPTMEEGHSVTCPQYRAYIDLSNVSSPAPGRYVEIPFAPTTATDIQSLDQTDDIVKFFQNGQLFIKKDGIIYDVLGRIVK